MTNIIICGVNGKMGQVLADAADRTDGLQVVAGVDKFPDVCQNEFPVYSSILNCREKADVVIDFSRPEALARNLEYVMEKRIPIVIATTGFSDEEKKMIRAASEQTPVFFSANMSLGVNLQMNLAKKAAEFLGEAYDIEIIEKHHNQKVDAPSGTALAIAEYINGAFVDAKEFVFGRHTKTKKRGREIGIHAVRGGTITGDHDVIFVGTDEIIEVNHKAQSKQIFAFGALRAAMFIATKPAGFYDMNDLIGESAVSSLHEEHGQAVITLCDMPFSPTAVSSVFGAISDKDIKLDIISQTAPKNGKITLSFSLAQSDATACMELMKPYETDGAALSVNGMLCKLTVEGAGMQRQAGVASKLFDALAAKNCCIYIISTSDTVISFCVDQAQVSHAIEAVKQAFNL